MRLIRLSRLFWMFGLLLIAELACNFNSAPSTATSDSPVQVSEPPASEPEQQGVSPVSLPDTRANQAGDVDSSKDATKKRVPGGDTFVKDLYERPFNANTMDTYFPYLDIVDTQGFKDDTWGFATITLSGTDANGQLPGKYGVELDLNKDGRGDWLILASNPSSTDWTTQGVQAWKDTNGDVGGAKPIAADTSSGDGYETLVFDQGKGDGPDGAWVRISPDDSKTVIVAFKLSMLGNPVSFAMGAWAGTDALNPAMFDLNDHMTHEQAGSPLPDLNVYPLKGLAKIDNTCRMAIGFSSTENVPGLCQTIQPKGPGPEPTSPPPPPPPPGIR